YWDQLSSAKREKMLAVRRRQVRNALIRASIVPTSMLVVAVSMLAWFGMTDSGRIASVQFSIMLKHLCYQPTDPRLLDDEERLAQLFLKQRKLIDGVNHVKTVADIIRRKSGPYSLELADVYARIAEIYYQIGQRDDAQSYAHSAVDIYESFGRDALLK